MFSKILPKEEVGSITNHQQLFARYILAVLIDLTVLNLIDEYWDYVSIDSFSISLLTAILLASLLKLTLFIEHHMAVYFKSKTSLGAKVMRFFSTWLVVFIAKLLILEAINYAFGDRVLFTGPIHGLVSFIVVVTAILISEQIVLRTYKSMA